MDCSTPGLPVHHQLPEFIRVYQAHLHWVRNAIHLSHPLSSPSPPTFNLSQHRGLFKWVSSSHRVAKVLAFQLQHQAFQWIFVFNKNLLVPLLWNVQKHKKLIELLPDSTKNVIPVLNHYSQVHSDFCTPQTLLPTQSTYFSFDLML